MTFPTRAIAIVTTVAGLFLAGCGSDEGSASDEAADMPAEMTTVKVGIQPVSSMAYLRLGEEQGFFEKRNIKLEFVDIATADVGMTSLMSNAINFTSANPPVQATAVDKDLPVRWVVAGVTSPAEDNQTDGIFVKPDSGIKSWADLTGRRVQVPCIKCISDLWVRLVVDADGGDSSKIEFVVLATADAPNALEQGTVDAISAFSALVPLVKAKGYFQVGDQIAETAFSQPINPFAVNTSWADDNKAVVRAFVGAASEAAEYADANIDEWRALLPKYYHEQIPDAEAAKKVIAHWSDCFDRDAVQTLIDGVNEYGWVTDVSVDDLFYDGIEPKFC